MDTLKKTTETTETETNGHLCFYIKVCISMRYNISNLSVPVTDVLKKVQNA